jgi:hypothetical protein
MIMSALCHFETRAAAAKCPLLITSRRKSSRHSTFMPDSRMIGVQRATSAFCLVASASGV